MIHYLTIYSNL